MMKHYCVLSCMAVERSRMDILTTQFYYDRSHRGHVNFDSHDHPHDPGSNPIGSDHALPQQ